MQFFEIRGNLFTAPPHFALAHCISADCKMGKGIALTFRNRYPNMPDELKKYNPQVGDTILSLQIDRKIFNMITKQKYNGKPTDKTMNTALESLKVSAQQSGVTHLAIPLIGCGLDRLDWSEVKKQIHQTFQDTDINIVAYHYEAPKILECSTKGDKRFSAFGARVTVWGKEDTIENHYQLAKRFGSYAPTNWKDAKGKQVTHMELRGKTYDVRYLSQWYKLLWMRYLDLNPDLVQYASQFDDFNDMFKGSSQNCQADVIRQYVKQGRESVWKDVEELWNTFRQRTASGICG